VFLALIILLTLASLTAPPQRVDAVPGVIIVNPGIIFHTVTGGGDLTFFSTFTTDLAYYNASSIVFTNLNWGAQLFGTVGFNIPANVTAEVTSITTTDILILLNSPGSNIGVYAPGRGTPFSVTGASSFSTTASNTTITIPAGVVTVDIKYGGGPGGSTYNYLVNLRRFENGSTCTTPYNATIVYLDGTGTFLTVNGDSTPLGTSQLIYAFTYPTLDLVNMRTLYYPPLLITPIIPNSSLNVATYIFTVRDPTGYLVGKTAFIDASKVVGGSEMLLSSNPVSSLLHQAYFLFQSGQLVHLTLRYSNATVYDFGYFMPTGANLNNFLDLYVSGYTSGIWHVGQIISVDSYWVGSNIVAVYSAIKPTTLSANITVRDRLNSTVIYTASAVADTTWTVPADVDRAYIVYINGTHSLLVGAWSYVKIIDPSTINFPPPPNLSFWTLGGVDLTTLLELAIPCFFLFMFSFKWRNVGMLAAMLIATVQWGIGWAPFWTWSLLAVGWMWALGWSLVIMESG
jgi:hypothetical protein